ncbi:MAG: hypothetical protein P8X82_13885, partial [Gemmatimonadales bacterium]
MKRGGHLNRTWLLLVLGMSMTGMVLGRQSQVVDDQALRSAKAEEWLTYGRDYAETHYSPLSQINRDIPSPCDAQ